MRLGKSAPTIVLTMCGHGMHVNQLDVVGNNRATALCHRAIVKVCTAFYTFSILTQLLILDYIECIMATSSKV